MLKYIQTYYKYHPLMKNLIIRDIKVKYRRSILGVLWSVLNPVLMMLVMTVIFSTLFKVSIENFPVYYLTGSILFSFFSEATNAGMVSILASASLLKKVYIPKYIFPVEKALFAFVNLLFSFIALGIIMAVTSTRVTWTALLFPVPIIYALIFSTGVGLILSVLAVFFRDILHIYSILLTAWTYFTPIFYPISIIPERFMPIMKINPLFHFITYLRQLILEGTVPSLKENLICFAFSFTAIIFGLYLFRKKQDKFVLYI